MYRSESRIHTHTHTHTYTHTGEEDYPQAKWGEGHLVVLKESSAFAKFGGAGSIDVPCITSDLEIAGPTGRAYWEVRVNKKIGLMKFGLGHFHNEGPGDPGVCVSINVHILGKFLAQCLSFCGSGLFWCFWWSVSSESVCLCVL